MVKSKVEIFAKFCGLLRIYELQLSPIVSRANSKWYKSKKVKGLALNSQLLTVQISTNDVQVSFLFLYYFKSIEIRKIFDLKEVLQVTYQHLS